MTPSASHASWLRARLAVLSDRKPAPGAPRTGLESAIEQALREQDGVWLVRHAESEPPSHSGASGDSGASGAAGGRWSVLDGIPAPPRDEWAGYVHANASYAERIIELISSDGVVWIHGHRWLLVAAALRGHGHRGPIGLLLDVPFPAHARLEALPWYADVMAALCQLDLIGFRSPECAKNFEACRARAGRRQPRIEIFSDNLESTARTAPAESVTGFLQLLGSAARRGPPRELDDPA
jgi:hypothetical protein